METKRIVVLIALCLTVFLTTVGCDNQKYEDRSAYEAIVSAEHISAEEAYASLKTLQTQDDDIADLITLLQKLTNCAGRFWQESESTGKTYYADVSFYLSTGKAFCEITYTGFVGKLADGSVTETTETGYLLESSPAGDLFGRELSFRILFSEERLFISWGDINDYTLTRVNKEPSDTAEQGNDFEHSSLYQTLLESIDNRFPSVGHSVVYDAANKALHVYVQAPDTSRTRLNSEKEEIEKTWNALADSLADFSSLLLSPLRMTKNVTEVNLYFVEVLNARNVYDVSDYLLWTQNGEIRYNYTEDIHPQTTVSVTEAPQMVSPTERASEAPTQKSSTATFGERNALQSALGYLEVMAFSYSGLIEQLEYEGYTSSEAIYAADHCGANWNEQAVKCARAYLDTMSFSRSELREQLEYEGFLSSQAEYALSVVY